MRRVAIVQARMGSTRLPGKVLADLDGASMLARVIARLRACARLDDVVVAVPFGPADAALVAEATRYGVGLVQGPAEDVLDRYVRAARVFRADVVVRITADCPLLDPGVVDAVVAALGDDVDYVSNVHQRSYPRGLDVEAMHRDVLERLARMARSAPAREHVTAFLFEAPALFRTASVVAPRDDSDLRWTVDTADDLAVVRRLYRELALGAEGRDYREVVAHVRAYPELARGNSHVAQKPWSGVDVA